MNKKHMLLGSVFSMLIACNSGIYANSEFKYPAYTKDGIQERTMHIKQMKAYKIVSIIKKLKNIDSKYDFEKNPSEYLGAVSYQAKQIFRMYDWYAPTDEHVKAIKLYAVIYEAFANAHNKKPEEQDKKLLADAHSKVSELINLAEKLKEDCDKDIE